MKHDYEFKKRIPTQYFILQLSYNRGCPYWINSKCNFTDKRNKEGKISFVS